MTRDNRGVLVGGLIALALLLSWTAGCCVHLHYHAPGKQTKQETTTRPYVEDDVLDWAIGDLHDG